MLAGIRAFFIEHYALEVDTPILSCAGTTDPAIESFNAEGLGKQFWLHTSPEFPMKRLLASGAGDIYQVAKVFRQGESGRLHNPEFTMLEWYRVGWDHHQLIDEVIKLISYLDQACPSNLRVEKVSYQTLLVSHLGLDPLDCDETELVGCAKERGIDAQLDLDKDGWLDLLMSHLVMPSLPADQLTVVYDYPASQAALSRINSDGLTAARFEVFWGSVELANGFHELTDAREQRLRFEKEIEDRECSGQQVVPIDEHLIDSLGHGLPDCSGVAIGLDRLLMKLVGVKDIKDVMAFPVTRA